MRRAFVIEVQRGSAPEKAQFEGRAEHVDSGRAKRFHSLQELGEFLERTLTEIEQQEQTDTEETPPEAEGRNTDTVA